MQVCGMMTYQGHGTSSISLWTMSKYSRGVLFFHYYFPFAHWGQCEILRVGKSLRYNEGRLEFGLKM